MDLEGKPVKKPFKPFLTQPRRRFKGNFDKGHNCNVNDYLSVMKMLCICLYRRMVETETMMNSMVYIRIMVKCIFTNIHIIGSNRTCL